ncbi:MAG: FAD-dependent oxidoreductase, partial [Mesorhizobium sp.]
MKHTPTPPVSTGLAALEAQLAQDLDFLELPAKPWVPERSHDGVPVRDVVVI